MKRWISLLLVVVLVLCLVPAPTQAEEPAGTVAPESPNYDLTQPFDQTYPELVQSEEVSYDEDTLLVKLPAEMGSAVTDAMATAGVAELAELFALKDEIWYEAQLVQDTDIHAAVEALRSVEDVLLVEYNYHAEVAGMADPEEVPADWLTNPRTAEQWYLEYCGIPSGTALLDHPGGTSDVIVAVIDTGVDFDHEDLANNIWVNEYEIPGNGIDDDGNGYTDDYYGVNIVTGWGNGDDDNGHGTHVAGIIAAENNDIGVVGIAYNVKIMPIKASSAAGVFNQADIARAVLYAYAHGAHVINMSFGGPGCTVAVQDALSVAFSECVLVASAGNNGAPNEGFGAIPNYPAALTYVLGVMSVGPSGVESSFTNWDVFAHNAVEYEVYAPGEEILSTIPNNGYASWSGTSMAAPVVAAMAALLRSQHPDTSLYSSRYIYGQLASTSGDAAICCEPSVHKGHNIPFIVNFHEALTNVPTPDVNMSDYALFDTVGLKNDQGVNNGDGVIDAGETIALGFTLRNQWGKSKDTIVTLDNLSPAGIPDPYITILNDTVNYGAVGTYSEGDCGRIYTNDLFTAWENPFYIQIAENCPNNYWFKLNVTVSCGNGMDDADTETYTTQTSILLLVRNGVVLPRVIDQDMTLSGDKLYIIPDATIIEYGATVTVEAGAHIQFWSSDSEDPYAETTMATLTVKGKFLVEGTADNMVYIYPSEAMPDYGVSFLLADSGEVSLRYADVTNLSECTDYYEAAITKAEHCYFRQNTELVNFRLWYSETITTRQSCFFPEILIAEDCVFDRLFHMWGPVIGYYERCAFIDCKLGKYGEEFRAVDCLFLGNCNDYADRYGFDADIVHVPTNQQESRAEIYECHYRAETDTTYIKHDGGMYNYGYSGDYSGPFRWWAYWLGGSLSYTETQEEADWLNQKMPHMNFEIGRNYRFLELPGEWTKEEVEARFREFESTFFPTFTGNAILNRLTTDTDPANWLRVSAPEAYRGDSTISGNYWGTANPDLIEKQILDYYDRPADLAKLIYEPYLTTPPENTFPFVTGITLFNKYGEEVTSVSNEEITFRVTFNRDMDTSIPLSVGYGPAEPYNDQTVEGHWVDARTWEGTKLIPTTIEGGYQYFRIADGCSAEDDLILCTDTARFMFHVAQSAAQSMELQVEANTEGVKLSWMQDDFDTLMGYNVYRSTSEDGDYKRINQTVLPSGTTEFLDTNVNAGTTYYYRFTVVKTDLAESDPSDIRSATAHQLTARVTKQPTCTEPGTVTYTCMLCGKRFTESIEPLGHNYEEVITEPTCTEQGHTTHTCTRCGDSYEDCPVDATGHTAGETVVENRVEAGCTVDGSYDEVVCCTVCGEEISRETTTIPATGHTWGDWVVVLKPTTKAPGEEQRTCSTCGETESREIPMLEYIPGDTNGDGAVNGKDLILLRQALAGWDATLDEAAADCNGDGTLNGKDLILLRQALAGWDVTLG